MSVSRNVIGRHLSASRGFRRVARRGALTAFAAAAAVVILWVLALWPAFMVLGAIVVLVIVLAFVAPEYGFIVAVFMFGIEGSLKIALLVGETPLPISSEAIAAGAIDAALILATASLIIGAGLAGLSALWLDIGRIGRIAAILLAAWLVLSLAQILLGEDVGAAAIGFRTTQLYVIAAIGGALLARRSRSDEGVVTTFMAAFACVAAYGALRVLTGPTGLERTYALSGHGVSELEGYIFRGVGSFSGAVGLVSFLVPAAVFSFAVVLMRPKLRGLPIAIVLAAVVAIAGSYVRAGLVALAGGVLVAAALSFRYVITSPRSRGFAFVGLASCLALAVTVATVASTVSPYIQERAEGIFNPLGDKAVQDRLATWSDAVETTGEHPFGKGLGTVGRGTTLTGESPVTTDNSYIKVFVEQGVLGGILFAAAVITTCVASGRNIPKASSLGRPVAVGGTAAFVSFLVLALAGEYIEQPGKVVAWTVVGMAIAASRAPPPSDGERTRIYVDDLLMPRRALVRVSELAPWILPALVLIVTPVVAREARTSEYSATAELVAVRHDVLPRPADHTGDVRAALSDEFVQRHVASLSGFLYDAASLPDRTSIERSPELAFGRGAVGPRIQVSAMAGSPERARKLADAVVQAIVVVSASWLARETDMELRTARERFESKALSKRERKHLLERMTRLRTLVVSGQHRLVVQRYAATPRTSGGWADRAVAVFPVATPSAPGRLAAAGYGLLFAGVLLSGVIAFRRRCTNARKR